MENLLIFSVPILKYIRVIFISQQKICCDPTLELFCKGNCNEGSQHTLKCLSIGTPKIINFPFVSNGKFMVITGPSIQAHHNEAVLCLNFGTPENNDFSIWNKWKIYCF